jgi:hypothetical protein
MRFARLKVRCRTRAADVDPFCAAAADDFSA